MKAKNIGNLIKSLALSAAMCAPLMAGIGFGDNVKAAENELTNVYRAYSPKSGEHIFSTVETYVRNLEPLGWVYEGIAYRGAKDSYSNITAGNSSNRIVYGLREKDAASEHDVKHLYTTDKNEYEVLQKRGWRGDGAIFFAPNTSAYPVHRLFNPRAASSLGAHHYTADANEIRVLVTQGWNDEGIVFYSAGPGEAASTSPSTGSSLVSDNVGFSKEVEDAFFEELNRIRVSKGHKALTRHAQLDAAARSRSDFVVDYYDSGKAQLNKKEKLELSAKGLPTSSMYLTYDPHKGSEEAYKKYISDASLHFTGELTEYSYIGANNSPKNIAKAMLNTYESGEETPHWGWLMSDGVTHIGLMAYIKNGHAYGSVFLGSPSDGSTIAGWDIRENDVHFYVDPFYPGMNEITNNYYLPEEKEEWEAFQNMKFQEWMKNQNPNVGTLDWLLEFRKMKDSK